MPISRPNLQLSLPLKTETYYGNRYAQKREIHVFINVNRQLKITRHLRNNGGDKKKSR
jgi:hypothetical protein